MRLTSLSSHAVALLFVCFVSLQPLIASPPQTEPDTAAQSLSATTPDWLRVATLAASTKANEVLKAPAAVAVATNGDVFIADTGHNQLRVVHPGGQVDVVAGTGQPGDTDGPALEARLRAPAGVAIQPGTNVVYIADTANHRIKRLTADGRIETVAGSGHPGFIDGIGAAADFHDPAGLAFAPNGDLYVADSLNHVIRKVAADGSVTTFAGGAQPGYADGAAPQALFHKPLAVAVGPTGDVFVADTLNHVIRRIAGGMVSTVAGTTQPGFADGAANAAQFHQPSGVAIESDTTLLVADAQNNRIRRVNLTEASVSTLTGTGHSGLTDGPPATAEFNGPVAIVVNGAAFIADSGNDALRVIYANVHLSSVDPNVGPAEGGTVVHIFGSGFVAGATQVTFGSSGAANVTFVSGNEITAVTPAGIGVVDITATTPGGASTLIGAYTFGTVLAVQSIVPRKGPTSGGITVTVTGSNFVPNGTRLFVGDREASNVVVTSPTTLTAKVSWSWTVGPVPVTVMTATGQATLPNGFIYMYPPSIAGFSPTGGFAGTLITIRGSRFDPDAGGTQVLLGSTPVTPSSVTATTITVVAPTSFTTSPIKVTTAGGIATSTKSFERWAPLVSLQVFPQQSLLGIGEGQQFIAIGTDGDGVKRDVSAAGATWSSSIAGVATVGATGRVSMTGAGTATITATIQGLTASGSVRAEAVEPLPPAPATVANAIDRTVPTMLADSMRFLFEGAAAIQRGVTPNVITNERISVIRGRVMNIAGQPVAGVRVSAVTAGEYGYTLTRSDGGFDFAANGGGYVTLQFEKSGYPAVQRQFQAQWEEFSESDPVLLTPFDAAATPVAFGAASTPQVARGSVISDSDGQRRATLLIGSGTEATMVLPDGTTRPVTSATVRATEYTVGANGPAAMPGLLPATSGYTYAVELSLDEAVAVHAEEVKFTKPVYVYLENFLAVPTGIAVPAGYYDRKQGRWIPAPNGRVIAVVSLTGDLADLDFNGDGVAETPEALAAAGVTADERRQVASLYTAGQTLWRVPVQHFTPWDLNFPYGPPAGATAPSTPDPEFDTPVDEPTCTGGSVIECENQTLGEAVAISGTGMKLHYASDRMAGRKQGAMKLHLSGGTMPPNVKRIDVEVTILGRQTKLTFPPQANLAYDFQWDGRDAYGRLVAARQIVNVAIGYAYDATYQAPADLAQSFGALSGIPMSGVRSRAEITLWKKWSGTLGHAEARDFGIGGWTLTEHHAYDRYAGVLFLGDGSRRSAHDIGRVIGTAAGSAGVGYNGDEGPADQLLTRGVRGVAVAPDGSIYFTENGTNIVRKLDRNGQLTRYAGVPFGDPFVEEGHPATETGLFPEGIAFGPDGLLYVTSAYHVLRVNKDGIVEIVAGNGTQVNSGDGGPARQAGIRYPQQLLIAADGTIYVTTNGTIRAITPDGYIHKVIGQEVLAERGFGGDGGPASQAKINIAWGMAFGPDGALYFADNYNFKIRRIGQDGIISTVAGTGCNHNNAGYNCYPDMIGSGDGGPATNALLWYPHGIAFDRSGAMYIGERWARIRRIDSEGIISSFSGQLTSGYSGDGGPAAAAKMQTPLDIEVNSRGEMFFGETNHLRRIGSPLPGFTEEETTIASADGSEVYVFDGHGRHLRTLNAYTGAVRYAFTYSGGKLSQVTDASGNTITIQIGGATGSIIAPGGQTTALTFNGDGYLSSITNPASESVKLGYGDGGLLTSFTDARNQVHQFTYDAGGRLLSDSNPTGGSKTLTRSGNETAFTVTTRTALGRATAHFLEYLDTGAGRRVTTDPAGLVTTTEIGTDESKTTTYPDGTRSVIRLEGDPRFGLSSPNVTSTTITPAGRALSESVKREVTLLDRYNPLSVQTARTTNTTNGRSYILDYDVAGRKVTRTSPAGRAMIIRVDALSRPMHTEYASLAPVDYSYDSRGLLSGLTSGARTATFVWNTRYELGSVTDALSRTTSFERDAAGRVTQMNLPGGGAVGYSYDANGKLASLTPPGRAPHLFTFDGMGRLLSYAPPGADASGTTAYEYDADGALKVMKRPGGDVVTIGYDAAGRPLSLSSRDIAAQYTYDGGGRTATLTGGGANLIFGYDGRLLTSLTWSGGVSGSVSLDYDNDFRPSAIGVNGSSIAMTYDPDGLLTTAGALALTRDGASGLINATTLGGVVDEYSYNSYGELTSYSANYNGTPLIGFTYGRDAAGRIVTRSQTGPVSFSETYDYDAAGHLKSVSRDGSVAVAYGYDPNGNRTSKTKDGVTTEAAYDMQDRLISAGTTSYTYAASGELTQKAEASGTTTFAYDGVGGLRKVLTPAETIEYVLDAGGRRVGRKVGGALTQAWLYDNQSRIVAELDGTGAVVSRFVYASRDNVPDYMVRGGVTYRIISDHLGSPRVVIDAATGAVAQYLQYDEFGNVLSDSNPGFQPFGFSGGLYDTATKLTRFGVRDYDAATGRWTAKDPVLFGAGDPNIYAYVSGDPINFRDPSGLGTGYVGLGGTVGAGGAVTGGVGIAVDTHGNVALVETLGAGGMGGVAASGGAQIQLTSAETVFDLRGEALNSGGSIDGCPVSFEHVTDAHWHGVNVNIGPSVPSPTLVETHGIVTHTWVATLSELWDAAANAFAGADNAVGRMLGIPGK